MNTQYKSCLNLTLTIILSIIVVIQFILLTLTKKENNYEKIIKFQFNNDCICNDVHN